MKIIKSDYFNYKNNKLFCEDVSVQQLAEKYGTPLYIYSHNFFKDRYHEFTNAFSSIDHQIFYAVKSNFNLSVIKTFIDEGSGADVNSEGELYRALKAGAKKDKLILTGVGKTAEEIRKGLNLDLLMIKAESEEEIHLINKIAEEMGVISRVAIRVNPDVDAQTHPYISTGLAENKFGVDRETALRLYSKQKELKNITYTGIDMHIGSQITNVEPFLEAVKKLSKVFFDVKKIGVELKHFDLGGGIGASYNDEMVFSVKEYANELIPELKKLNCKILFEPGRFLTANGGILVTKVLYNKVNTGKNFIVVDSAINDILRPSFYKAYHHIQPVELTSNKDITADIVGPICETGDFFARSREISQSESGSYLALLSAGSYGMVMSSNYNARRRPAEILVDGNNYKVIRSRETFEHLIYDEIID
ncbi:MAG TPA: diaminopimelate decarboxylase [Ignavibacteriaceae bacterium]|nr:diaminopimelate decarboxylase [Ignavibacteriaceae bacterium]